MYRVRPTQKLKVDDRCVFVESTLDYPEQQLTEGVVVSYKGGNSRDGEYIVRVQRQDTRRVEWRSVSESRIFHWDDRVHALDEAGRLNKLATIN